MFPWWFNPSSGLVAPLLGWLLCVQRRRPEGSSSCWMNFTSVLPNLRIEAIVTREVNSTPTGIIEGASETIIATKLGLISSSTANLRHRPAEARRGIVTSHVRYYRIELTVCFRGSWDLDRTSDRYFEVVREERRFRGWFPSDSLKLRPWSYCESTSSYILVVVL